VKSPKSVLMCAQFKNNKDKQKLTVTDRMAYGLPDGWWLT
jgi:hypothetical protein